MGDEEKKEALTRRGFLGASSAALAAASLLSAKKLAAQEQSYQKPKSDRSASDPGPTNPALDAANPDSNSPVPTDAGAVTTFKYPFSFAHKRLQEGGWSREVTQRELSISTTLAGVDMRLTAGGVRELHWHSAAEWALMLYGTARITCIDADGKSFVTDIKENDLWFFPPGIPHSIQGLAPDGCEFLLVFDDGNFSEYETVLLSDWMAHTPPEVLAKNFGVSQSALANPARSRTIAASPPERWVLRLLILLSAPWTFLPPRATRAAKSASSTRKISKYPPSPPRSSRSSPAASASCIGIPTLTNGNTSLPARDA
jgi:oxalate decarboxylase